MRSLAILANFCGRAYPPTPTRVVVKAAKVYTLTGAARTGGRADQGRQDRRSSRIDRPAERGERNRSRQRRPDPRPDRRLFVDRARGRGGRIDPRNHAEFQSARLRRLVVARFPPGPGRRHDDDRDSIQARTTSLRDLSCVVKTAGEPSKRVVAPDHSLVITLASDPASGNSARGRPDSIYNRQPTNRMGVVWMLRSELGRARTVDDKSTAVIRALSKVNDQSSA